VSGSRSPGLIRRRTTAPSINASSPLSNAEEGRRC